MARLHIYQGMNLERYLFTEEPGPWARCQECGADNETILDTARCIPCQRQAIYEWNQEMNDNLCSQIEQ